MKNLRGLNLLNYLIRERGLVDKTTQFRQDFRVEEHRYSKGSGEVAVCGPMSCKIFESITGQKE